MYRVKEIFMRKKADLAFLDEKISESNITTPSKLMLVLNSEFRQFCYVKTLNDNEIILNLADDVNYDEWLVRLDRVLIRYFLNKGMLRKRK